ncbi:hypothetical protein HNR46_003426 [Haloferula luteola]|uniref:PEP-CTERM protein-sorting domain-containing protein n=1 Tax=Haloferula luteola TaxID=595692 RepID=A0A840V5C8_9BACT|nr:PEP-CTERM sorting domain-containing protein [Haloferula luteola]MBB5353172.1 hypothetical protein [Haloferula luteola]
MKTSKTLLAASLGALLAPSVQAASVVLVTQDTVRDADLITHLESLGHTVTTGAYSALPDNPGDVSTLEAADLVIVSRNTNSGDYATDAAEVAAWDNLSTTVLLGNSYISRNNRWNWISTANLQLDYALDISGPVGTATVHPFYNGLTPTLIGDPAISGLEKYSFTVGAGSDLPDGGGVLGSGVTIGVRNNASIPNVILASWEIGGSTGSGNLLAGDRYFYAMPEDFSNFLPNGVQILDNIVATAVPEPSILLLGSLIGAGWIVRRRRD